MAVAERYEGLEPTTANLKRILGDDGMRALTRAFGGRRLYVPRAPGASHPITVALGADAAAHLAGAFRGEDIDVPMLPETKAEIRRLDGLGWTRSRIARELGITERWVYMTLSNPEVSPPKHPDLFS